jgi:signal transduction histidine kinase
MVVPVVFRRRSPRLAFAVGAAGAAIQLIFLSPSPADVALVVLLYTVAAYRPRRESVTALLICLAGSTIAIIWSPDSAARWLFWLGFGAAWVLGDSMRYRRAYYLSLQDRTARLEAERDAQAKIAAAAERARIARELHDVIAHNVSVMVVQADGAGYMLRSDPERAAAALGAVSRTGRQALAEMRRLLGVLRAGDEDRELAPVPGLGQLRELLDQARAAGLPVSFTLQGAPGQLPEGAELAAYRVVQESLTNTRKHGGAAAAAAVALHYQPDGLVVQVTDDGLGATAAAQADRAGLGLTGMRERIAMYGGTVQAGPRPGGGYQVTARLPRQQQPPGTPARPAPARPAPARPAAQHDHPDHPRRRPGTRAHRSSHGAGGAVSAVYAWLRRHPLLVDGVLAVLLALFALSGTINLVGVDATTRSSWLRLPVIAMIVVPVVFRRRSPLLAFAVAAAGAAIQVIFTPPSSWDVALVVLLYTVAAYRPRRESITALVICLAGLEIGIVAWAPSSLGIFDELFVGGAYLGASVLIAWVLGDSMRYRRAYYLSLEDRAARLEAEREAQARVAVAAERARIARELHDVVAHNVSVMVVQADGAGYVLRSDPERAAAALAAVAGTGRRALAEMRRLLGVLRAGDEDAGLVPVPGLGQLRELLDQARAAGLPVSFTLQGAPGQLPEGAELAVFRVVQESLTNTRKHGGAVAAAVVALRYQADGLVVQVTDDGLGAAAVPQADGGGLGLTGMRERIGLYGGTVQAGPLPGGGYQVTARLPRQPQPPGQLAQPPAAAASQLAGQSGRIGGAA